MYDLSTLPTVFLHVGRLPKSCRPAQVIRHEGKTLVWTHPGTFKALIVMWSMENLTDDERAAFRLAYAMEPDVRVPVDDGQMAGRMSYLQDIPPILRLPYVRRRDRQKTA